MPHVVATINCNVYCMEFPVKFVVLSHSVYSLVVVTAGDEANGHVRPSSSLRFVQYGLDLLALIFGHCRCVG